MDTSTSCNSTSTSAPVKLDLHLLDRCPLSALTWLAFDLLVSGSDPLVSLTLVALTLGHQKEISIFLTSGLFLKVCLLVEFLTMMSPGPDASHVTVSPVLAIHKVGLDMCLLGADLPVILKGHFLGI